MPHTDTVLVQSPYFHTVSLFDWLRVPPVQYAMTAKPVTVHYLRDTEESDGVRNKTISGNKNHLLNFLMTRL